jgi:hypothetical protein
MLANVTQDAGTEQGVGHGVGEDISVRGRRHAPLI